MTLVAEGLIRAPTVVGASRLRVNLINKNHFSGGAVGGGGGGGARPTVVLFRCVLEHNIIT